MFTECLLHGVVPSQWRHAHIHKKGDVVSNANYRPISLPEILRKLYERLLLAP